MREAEEICLSIYKISARTNAQTVGDLNMLYIRKEKKVVFALKIFPSNRDSRGANMTEVLCLLTFHNLCICYSQVFPFETSSDYLIFLSAFVLL
jgi:hypothetical protein